MNNLLNYSIETQEIQPDNPYPIYDPPVEPMPDPEEPVPDPEPDSPTGPTFPVPPEPIPGYPLVSF